MTWLMTLLFGPRTTPELHGGARLGTYFRAGVLDLETVFEATERAEELLRESSARSEGRETNTTWTGATSDTTPERLRAGAAPERRHVVVGLNISGVGSTHVFYTAEGSRPRVRVQITADDINFRGSPAIEEQLAEFIVARSVPRFQWNRLLRPLAYLPTIVLAAALLWASVTMQLHPAALIFALTVVALSLFVGIALERQAKAYIRDHQLSNRIRNESRAQTYARRADSHRDLKVGVITFVATAAAAVLAGYLGGLFSSGDAASSPTPSPRASMITEAGA